MGYTPVYIKLQAGTWVGARDYLGTGPVGKQLLEEVQGLPYAARGGEGAEVAGPVLGDPSSDVYLGEVLCQVYLEEWIALVVLEPGVVAGPDFLIRVHSRIRASASEFGHYVFEVRHLGYHLPDLWAQVLR